MKTIPFSIKERPSIRRAKVAKTYFQRARGLIGSVDLSSDEGMLIERCNAIHTFFMSFSIDVYFLDKSNNVVKTVLNVKPWTFFVWGGWKAKKVLEVKASDSRR